MNLRSLGVLASSLWAVGCTCGAFDPNVTRFACQRDDDCGPGFVCAPSDGAQECVLASATGGGGGGALTGGGSGGGLGGGGGQAMGGGSGGGGFTDGGPGGGTDAGTDGGSSDAGSDGGTDAGVPDHLVITTPAQTLIAGACSSPLTVQVRDQFDRPIAVTANLQLTLSSSLAQVSFFGDTTCAGGSTLSTTIPLGATFTTVAFHGQQPGTTVLTIGALAGKPGAVTQTQTLTALPTSLVFLSAAPTAPLAGACLLATVEARYNATPTSVAADATITLQSTVPGGLRFFSDPACATSATSTLMPGGQSRASFYVKTITGGLNTISAIAPFGTATQAFQVTGVVRRGQCFLGSLQTTVACPIGPAHQSTARTMVVYQATSTSSDPADYEVRCRLTTADTLTCERNGTGAGVNISWQTAELPTGLAVQRGAASRCPLDGIVPLVPPVTPASAFVLSAFSGLGPQFDADNLSAMRLAPDGGHLVIDNRDSLGEDCTAYEYQLVQLSGVSSLRGSSGALSAGQRQLTVSGLPAASTNTVLLNQAVMSAVPPSTLSMCNLLVRSELASPTSLLFSRGADQINPLSCSEVAIADLPWERVDFGSRARVQPFTVALTNNSFDVTIASVDPTRTLVFAGGQMAGGQSSGETAFDNQGDDSIGQAQARFDLANATTVRVTRGRSQSSGLITFYVVELEP